MIPNMLRLVLFSIFKNILKFKNRYSSTWTLMITLSGKWLDVNFDIKYEGHQNCSKTLSMPILRVFGDHHM